MLLFNFSNNILYSVRNFKIKNKASLHSPTQPSINNILRDLKLDASPMHHTD